MQKVPVQIKTLGEVVDETQRKLKMQALQYKTHLLKAQELQMVLRNKRFFLSASKVLNLLGLDFLLLPNLFQVQDL